MPAHGFLGIAGHGIPEQVIAEAWGAARAFFDLPMDSKLEVKMPYVGYPYGYSPLQAETLAKSLGEETPPDLKESFRSGRWTDSAAQGMSRTRIFVMRRICGRRAGEFPRGVVAYYRAMGELAARIMRVFAVALESAGKFLRRCD